LAAQQVWQPDLEVQPAEVLRPQVSPPQVVRAQLVQQVSLRELARGPQALQPPGDEQAQLEEQEPPQARVACVKPPSPPLLSLNAPLPPRFPRPLRLSGGP